MDDGKLIFDNDYTIGKLLRMSLQLKIGAKKTGLRDEKMGKVLVNKAIGNSHMLSYSLTYSILLSTSQQRPGCQ